MSDIRLSIIIPVYNVEAYLAQCLDSVFDQDIPLDEYEVICVNDASPDNSREIVLDYMKRYPNLKLVEHDHNRQLGAARNSGRAIAQGRYVWNVDSDDMIAPDCLCGMLQVCEENDLDVLEFGYKDVDGNSLCDNQIYRDNQIITGLSYLEKYHLDSLGTICGIWRKIYRKKFLDEKDIISPPINMGEDESFAIQVFGSAERMSYYDKECYIYRINNLSLTGENRNTWSAEKWYEASFVCGWYMDKALYAVKRRMNNEVRTKLMAMIEYDISSWRRFNVSNDTQKQFWQICLGDFFHNLFVFRYFNRRAIYEYVANMIKYFGR